MKRKTAENKVGKTLHLTGLRPEDFKRISDLSEIEEICNAPLEVAVVVRGKPVVFIGRRLTPNESREVQLILESALPPMIREGDKEPVYNFEDPGYKKKKDEAWVQGRALAIWTAFPVFKEKATQEQAKLPNAVEIAKWIGNRKLDDDVLETLFAALTQREVGVYLGFTSGNNSPTS